MTGYIFIFGTRPEWIKIRPVVNEMKSRKYNPLLIFTGQHDIDMMDDDFINTPHHNLMLNGIAKGKSLTERLGRGLEILSSMKPPKDSYIIVQGDTMSAYIGAVYAYTSRIPFGYIEAGLLTHRNENPFPEEGFRRMILPLASECFAPTQLAMNACMKYGTGESYLVGNTIASGLKLDDVRVIKGKVLCSLHRRENDIETLFSRVVKIAKKYPDHVFHIPIHPSCVEYRDILTESINIVTTGPLPRDIFLYHLRSSEFVITDSGGVQEETFLYNKPVIVVRKVTERPDLLKYNGFLSPDLDIGSVDRIKKLKLDPGVKINLYGDTSASSIVNILERRVGW